MRCFSLLICSIATMAKGDSNCYPPETSKPTRLNCSVIDYEQLTSALPSVKTRDIKTFTLGSSSPFAKTGGSQVATSGSSSQDENGSFRTSPQQPSKTSRTSEVIQVSTLESLNPLVMREDSVSTIIRLIIPSITSEKNQPTGIESPKSLEKDGRTQSTKFKSLMTKKLLDKFVMTLVDPSPDDLGDPLLVDALSFIARNQLRTCDLVLAFDEGYANSLALKSLFKLPHLRQILVVRKSEDFLNLLWTSPRCRGYYFLFKHPVLLYDFMDLKEDPWDYEGRYVFAGLTKADLNLLASTKKGKKTEQIVGLVKETADEWKVYMNQLFWGEEVTVVNRWRKRGFTSHDEIFPDKISNLRGAPIKVVSFHYEPHTFISKDDEGQDHFEGSDINLARALSDALNFTLDLQESPKGEYWGMKSANGSWSGLVGKVARNEAHFGLAFTFLTNNFGELEALEYSRFYSYDRSCFMARTEPPLPRWQAPAAPFRYDTWLVAFVGFLVFCPIIALLAKSSKFSDSESKNLQKFSYSNLYTWGMHFRIAQPRVPKTTPTQIWVAFLWIYSIVLTISYNCNLITFLFVERPRARMETIKEIYTSDVDVLGVGFFFKESLKQSRNIYLQGLVPRFRNIPGHHSSFPVLERGEGVLIADNTLLEYLLAASLTEPNIPSIRIMEECFSTYNVAIILQRHFPLKRSFDKVLASLFDQGLMRQWFLNAFQFKKDKQRQKQATNDHEGEEGEAFPEEKRAKRTRGVEIKGGIPLGIDHMEGVFFIYLLGLSLASVMVVFEVSCFSVCSEKQFS